MLQVLLWASAGAQQAELAEPGALSPWGRQGETPTSSAKPVVLPAPLTPYSITRMLGREGVFLGVALILCVIQVRLRPQQLFPLAAVGCCSSASSKHLK